MLIFTVKDLSDSTVSILSVFENKILISREGFSQLFIYNHEGHHLSTITIGDMDRLRDATWTPQGNIVFTNESKTVVVISRSGEIINNFTQITDPQCLSVSNDGIIYLADLVKGVYKSTDGGVSWSFVFISIWHYKQVIKVNTNDHNDDFWVLENSDVPWHLRRYSVNRSFGNFTWTDVNWVRPNAEIPQLHAIRISSISYDDDMAIF